MGKELAFTDAETIQRKIEQAMQNLKDNPMPVAGNGPMSPKDLMEKGNLIPFAAMSTVAATVYGGIAAAVGLGLVEIDTFDLLVLAPITAIGSFFLGISDSIIFETRKLGLLTTRVLRRKHYQREHCKHFPDNFKEQEKKHYQALEETTAVLTPILEEINRHEPLIQLTFKGGKIVMEDAVKDFASPQELAKFAVRHNSNNVKAIEPAKQLSAENLAI